ncbi:MAG: hypothetical protein HQL03_02790 [Nitrospirae bacterium]|nr:hypothetical protein [Nitrospirota bacterium]MBF0590885.1 hypothetical protein [Nitrospirota bacterium]
MSVTLTATAASGSIFGAWTGCDSTNDNQCTVIMSSNKNISVSFNPASTLTITMTGSGTNAVKASTGTISWSGNTGTVVYASGAAVTLTATAGYDAVFGAWTGCDSTSGNQCIITMSANRNVSVSFTAVFTLTITKTGTGMGSVTVSTGTINWSGSTGTSIYAGGTLVILNETPDSNSTFGDWSGCDTTSSDNKCTVTMSMDKQITAAFQTPTPTSTPTPSPTPSSTPTPTPSPTAKPSPSATPTPTPTVILTITIKGAGSGTVTAAPGTLKWDTSSKIGAASYKIGTDVTITTTPGLGFKAIWMGCDDNIGNIQCQVKMNTNKSVTVEFASNKEQEHPYDFDGDGNSDALWYNAATGDVLSGL